MLYLPKPSHSEPLCLDSASQQRPHSMHARQQACFEHGECDKADVPGTGSLVFHINSWAMVFPSDHPVLHE